MDCSILHYAKINNSFFYSKTSSNRATEWQLKKKLLLFQPSIRTQRSPYSCHQKLLTESSPHSRRGDDTRAWKLGGRDPWKGLRRHPQASSSVRVLYSKHSNTLQISSIIPNSSHHYDHNQKIPKKKKCLEGKTGTWAELLLHWVPTWPSSAQKPPWILLPL